MCAFVFRWYGGTGGTLSPHEPVNTCPEKGTSSLEMTCLRGFRITRGMYAISISWVVPWVSAYDDAQVASHWSRTARTRAAQNLVCIRKVQGDAKPPLPGYTDRIRPSAGTSTARTSRSDCDTPRPDSKTASKNRILPQKFNFCREKSRKLTSPLGEAAQPCSGARMPHCPQDCA